MLEVGTILFCVVDRHAVFVRSVRCVCTSVLLDALADFRCNRGHVAGRCGLRAAFVCERVVSFNFWCRVGDCWRAWSVGRGCRYGIRVCISHSPHFGECTIAMKLFKMPFSFLLVFDFEPNKSRSGPSTRDQSFSSSIAMVWLDFALPAHPRLPREAN